MEEIRNIFNHMMEFKLSWGEEVSYDYLDNSCNPHKLKITNFSGDGFKVEISIHISQWDSKSSEELNKIEQEIDYAVNRIKHITY